MTLVTPAEIRHPDPAMVRVTSAIADGLGTSELCTGMMIAGHWSVHYTHAVRDWINTVPIDGVPIISVVDGPMQWLALYGDAVEADPRMLAAFFVHIPKDPDSEGGGWRWHKWGAYVGNGNPQCEYLDDEQGFDGGVWTAALREVITPRG